MLEAASVELRVIECPFGPELARDEVGLEPHEGLRGDGILVSHGFAPSDRKVEMQASASRVVWKNR
jgi:hypothetical protein